MNEQSAAKKKFFEREWVRSVAASLICILGGLVVGFLVLVILAAFNENISFGEAFRGIVTVLGGPFSAGSAKDVLFQLGNTLFQSTPLIMTGLSVALAFKTGLFNIGAPGQYLMGATGALLVSLSIPTTVVPAVIVWILALLAGIILGVLWGAIPGFFKAKFNVNEVIVCIMTNWIAANVVSWVFGALDGATNGFFVNHAETKVNFIRKTATNGVATWSFGLDKLFGGSYLDIGIFIASLIAVALYIIINKTTFGYELRACGFNKNASKYAGMNEKRNIILSMAIAGGLAACGAALWCLNGAQDFKWDTYLTLPADGFNGIPAALLASNNPIGVIFAAIFLKYLGMGGSNLAAYTSFNEYVSPLIIAVIIYFAGASKLIKDILGKRAKARKAQPEAAKDAEAPTPPPDPGPGDAPADPPQDEIIQEEENPEGGEEK